MMNSSLGDLNVTENYYQYNNISDKKETNFPVLGAILWTAIISIICCFGLVGNGYIIWLLGFQIKRNSFTTVIFNLAIADFGSLTAPVIYSINAFINILSNTVIYLCTFLTNMMYINANFLLTAISIDRCVAVLFPIWHHCSRPKHLSSIVCILLWISSSLLSGIIIIMDVFLPYYLLDFPYLVTAIVCFPLITVSTLVLFIKVRLKSNQRNQGRLLLIILITLLCFLIFASPFSVIIGIYTFYGNINRHLFFCGVLLSSLNSSINPFIYFLVGRKRGPGSKESMKVVLQKVFKEAKETGGRSKSSNSLSSGLPSE